MEFELSLDLPKKEKKVNHNEFSEQVRISLLLQDRIQLQLESWPLWKRCHLTTLTTLTTQGRAVRVHLYCEAIGGQQGHSLDKNQELVSIWNGIGKKENWYGRGTKRSSLILGCQCQRTPSRPRFTISLAKKQPLSNLGSEIGEQKVSM